MCCRQDIFPDSNIRLRCLTFSMVDGIIFSNRRPSANRFSDVRMVTCASFALGRSTWKASQPPASGCRSLFTGLCQERFAADAGRDLRSHHSTENEEAHRAGGQHRQDAFVIGAQMARRFIGHQDGADRLVAFDQRGDEE